MRATRMAGLGLLSLTTALGGCAGQRSTTKTRDAVRAASGVVDLNRLAYPLDRYELGERELQSTIHARYVLTQRCVDRFHLVLPARESGRHLPSREDRYGISDEHTARTWAYSLDRPPGTATPWELKVPWQSRLFAVVNGVDAGGQRARIAGLPKGGCRARANRTLERGSGPGEHNPVPSLERKAWNASEHSPTTKAALREWNRCLARKGYHYADPVDAPVSYWTKLRMQAHPVPTPHERRYGVRPSAGEKRAAIADVRCKQESALIAKWATADIAAQQKLISANRDQLRHYREALDRIVQSAERVVRASRG